MLPLVAKGGRIHLDHLAAGLWAWTVYDAKTGTVTGQGQGTADANGLDVVPGEQDADFAFKVKAVNGGGISVGP